MARISTILCAANPAGDQSGLERLRFAADEHDVDAIAVVGDLSSSGAPDGYRRTLQALLAADRPAFWVPGPGDAPLGTYIRESLAAERIHPQVRGVHGTAWVAPDAHLVIAGLGGVVDDDPGAERDEQAGLRYPRLEAEYRLRVLENFPDHPCAMLFWSRAASSFARGSETVEELVQTYRPRLVVLGGRQGTGTLGKRSLVVAPGSLREGCMALGDIHTHDVELLQLAPTPPD
jgi:uncharacterized protein